MLGALACALFASCQTNDAETQASNPELQTPLPSLAGTLEGGQTGSGGMAPRLACATTSDADCEAIIARRYPLQFDTRLTTSSQCVPAWALDPTFTDDTPVCRCTYRLDEIEDPAPAESEQGFVLGLARRRALRAEPGDDCELRARFRGLSDQCLLEATAFPGCQLDQRHTSCDDICRTVSAAGVAVSQRIVEQLELLGVGRSCYGDEPQSARAYCIGALRLSDQCWAAVASSQDDWLSFSEVECDQSVERMIQAGAADIIPRTGETARELRESPDAGAGGSL
jgi:hypothetical protein